jgi:hypothetical protein
MSAPITYGEAPSGVFAGDESSVERRSCCITYDPSMIIVFMSCSHQKNRGSLSLNGGFGADTFQIATLGFRHHKADKKQCQDAECSVNAKGGSISRGFDQ